VYKWHSFSCCLLLKPKGLSCNSIRTAIIPIFWQLASNFLKRFQKVLNLNCDLF
jgi:hypothetical protein